MAEKKRIRILVVDKDLKIDYEGYRGNECEKEHAVMTAVIGKGGVTADVTERKIEQLAEPTGIRVDTRQRVS